MVCSVSFHTCGLCRCVQHSWCALHYFILVACAGVCSLHGVLHIISYLWSVQMCATFMVCSTLFHTCGLCRCVQPSRCAPHHFILVVCAGMCNLHGVLHIISYLWHVQVCAAFMVCSTSFHTCGLCRCVQPSWCAPHHFILVACRCVQPSWCAPHYFILVVCRCVQPSWCAPHYFILVACAGVCSLHGVLHIISYLWSVQVCAAFMVCSTSFHTCGLCRCVQPSWCAPHYFILVVCRCVQPSWCALHHFILVACAGVCSLHGVLHIISYLWSVGVCNLHGVLHIISYLWSVQVCAAFMVCSTSFHTCGLCRCVRPS